MERQIGETFEYKGKKLKVVTQGDCGGCFFSESGSIGCANKGMVCSKYGRKDETDISFVEVPTEAPTQQQVEEQLFEKDNVNHPSHYTWLKDVCGIEVIDITRHMDFNIGNSLKYILRSGHKSEQGVSDRNKAIEDLKKAVWYLNDEIKMLEEK